ncbi:MAG: type II toxin-antitoxin system RelB/DinJ family antitoxin [Eubacteriales bacterium]|nr:type II toxin-antitoxin system RelB/DinJ family antitoxin [Clostridiales bacterium]MDY5835987.1 type II toxin-antitoxin system RelB/DinJ family antitoxin [Eubacteriales bacterium]
MSRVPTQIRIEAEVKKQATELFGELGMDMSSAVNIFLKQCILRGGLPFSVEVPQYSPKLIQAMDEALRISRDPNVVGYTNMDDLRKALEE